jgi:hypothetical protein
MISSKSGSADKRSHMANPKGPNRYQILIQHIFFARHEAQSLAFEFAREEIEAAAKLLDMKLPKNVGDMLYSFRYRNPLPDAILATQPDGKEWIIEPAGRAVYRFKLVPATRIVPRDDLVKIAIPDATPELIRAYALDDEQALLAIVRYNRLIDTFLGLTTYSLQNHLRTTVDGMGQIEIDELYVGLDRHGCHGKDQIGVVQTTQDIRFVEQKFPGMRCRAISAQFLDRSTVVLFELGLQDEAVCVIEERHYRLVPAAGIDQAAIRQYRD